MTRLRIQAQSGATEQRVQSSGGPMGGQQSYRAHLVRDQRSRTESPAPALWEAAESSASTQAESGRLGLNAGSAAHLGQEVYLLESVFSTVKCI